jgi:hypothetical protein
MADLRITRDRNGTVTITDVASGRSETTATPARNRALEAVVVDKERLPGHFWGRIED